MRQIQSPRKRPGGVWCKRCCSSQNRRRLWIPPSAGLSERQNRLGPLAGVIIEIGTLHCGARLTSCPSISREYLLRIQGGMICAGLRIRVREKLLQNNLMNLRLISLSQQSEIESECVTDAFLEPASSASRVFSVSPNPNWMENMPAGGSEPLFLLGTH